MLFRLPDGALDCNWLNPAIIETLINGMNDDGSREWRDHLPAARRDVLGRKIGLERNLNEFWNTYRRLSQEERVIVRRAIVRQTDLPNLFSDTDPCPSACDLPEQIKTKASQLARYLFKQLSVVKNGERNLRDAHFNVIHSCGIRVCPFCGLHAFRTPGDPRNELDHLMAISRYPFAAADF